MKYIGPFFRMNSVSSKEIESQLLFFSREALKHIALESKCGILTPFKSSKRSLSSKEFHNFKDFNPILCIYKKAKPIIYSSKHSKSWDDITFKKDVLSFPNALMTLSILELTKYYDEFENTNSKIRDFSKYYKSLAKFQLEFYYGYLRNSDGFFVDKKYLPASSGNEFNLTEKDKDFTFSDQAFMMCAYYLYSEICTEDEDSENYKGFSLEILDMFLEFKDHLYNLSFDECSKICFAFNIMYKYSKNDNCKHMLIDFCEFILSKFYNSYNSPNSDLEDLGLLNLNLILCYKQTNILLFKDGFEEISIAMKNMFDLDKCILQKPSDKKEIKYSSLELTLYLINIILYEKHIETSKQTKDICGELYKKYFINSGLITSFPEAPSLDSYERYINFSLRSDDLLDEIMFRMPNTNVPELTGLASIFKKNVTYSRKKENFVSSKDTFDSSKNMFIFFLIISSFNDDYIKSLTTAENISDINYNSTSNSRKSDSKPTTSTFNNKPVDSRNDIPHSDKKIEDSRKDLSNSNKKTEDSKKDLSNSNKKTTDSRNDNLKSDNENLESDNPKFDNKTMDSDIDSSTSSIDDCKNRTSNLYETSYDMDVTSESPPSYYDVDTISSSSSAPLVIDAVITEETSIKSLDKSFLKIKSDPLNITKL